MNRRSALAQIAALFSGLLGLCVAVPGLRFLLDPLWRRRRNAGFIRVARLSVLSEVGPPVRVIVSADRWDAFTHYPLGPIGSVWLTRDEDVDAQPKVRCLQTICPHLGCGVDYVSDRGAFTCPCHTSEFAPDGTARFGPAPRGMDELACRVTEPDEAGARWIEVEYQEFQTGFGDRRPIA